VVGVDVPSGGDSVATPVVLSVVIACRDVGAVLGFQLLALSRQRFPVPWEILVCDNGSTDDTVRLARGWTGRIPVRIVDARHASGLVEARNLGVAAARGRWVAFCDADTEIGDGWSAVLCAALAEHSVVLGRFVTEGPRSRRRRGGLTPGQANRFRSPSLVAGLAGGGGGSLAMHRSAFLAAGGFDPSAALGSTDLCRRLRGVGQVPVVVPDLVTHVWVRATAAELFALGRRQGRWYTRFVQRRRSDGGRCRPAGAVRAARPSPDRPIVEWPGSSATAATAWCLGWQLGRLVPAARSRGRSAEQPTSSRLGRELVMSSGAPADGSARPGRVAAFRTTGR
jgi:cellulose synthase/poly-beta-1,6-N-acetylglucosamine synthase-like glycosyltransferase